jgi:hypothetical protein
MLEPIIEEKKLDAALFHFIFPFSLNKDCQKSLKQQLEVDGFQYFSLENTDLETAFYGTYYRISHVNLERYYLPFTNNVIFPHNEDELGFRRYSKYVNKICTMKSGYQELEFIIQSVDVFLCPFDLGFITVRVEQSSNGLTFTDALEFANRFRVLQNMTPQDDEVQWVSGRDTFNEIEEFMFKVLVPGMLPFLDTEELGETYFAKLPFFVDERMYVQALFVFKQDLPITAADLFRASHTDGINMEQKPYISSTNKEFINKYVEQHSYERWAPNTYYMMEETSFVSITNQTEDIAIKLGNHMYGEYYYALLINLFHKIVLLKLSNLYSHVRLGKNQDKIENLIRSITTFSAKYYFNEVVSQAQGKEIFIKLRKQFANEELYTDVKQTLADLYKYQDNFTSKRSNYLLLVLTIYTVISGIFGMNQVIEDLKGDINWEKMLDYSSFEYLALIVTFTGIIVALWLGATTIMRMVKEVLKRKN